MCILIVDNINQHIHKVTEQYSSDKTNRHYFEFGVYCAHFVHSSDEVQAHPKSKSLCSITKYTQRHRERVATLQPILLQKR